MSDLSPISPLQGAVFTGYARISALGPMGMITLRAKDVPGLADAVKAVTGTPLPAVRRIENVEIRQVHQRVSRVAAVFFSLLRLILRLLHRYPADRPAVDRGTREADPPDRHR